MVGGGSADLERGRFAQQGRQTLRPDGVELEVEDLGKRGCGGAAPRRCGREAEFAAIEVKAASSSPQAVIQSVNGAGSRSTLSA